MSMINGYDIAYGLGIGLTAPFWLVKSATRRKFFTAFSQRMGRGVPAREADAPAVMIHAVSLGEINATRSLVDALRQSKRGLHFIISTTTETGFTRGQEIYGGKPDVTLVRYPLDFSPSVNRLLDALRPDVVALMELEVWPNFLRKCRRRGVPVVLVNGRLTQQSFRRYKLLKMLVPGMFARLAAICAQDQTYANRFIALGAPADRVSVTGTMKFDTAKISDTVAGADELGEDVHVYPGRELIWVCGSTGPGEEKLVLAEYRKLLAKYSRLRLVIVPRKPERFDEVADLIREMKFRCVRRSRYTHPPEGPLPPVILGDTIGELRKFYALADVVFVGRTLLDLGDRQHGSDMLEPAALGKPVIVGPHTGNFAEPMNALKAADAVVEVTDAETLGTAVLAVLAKPEEAKAMARRAQEVIIKGQGATAKHARVILNALAERMKTKAEMNT